jgi:hypothetical protein
LFDMFVQIVVQQPKGGLRLATMSPADQAAARTMIEKMSMPDARRAELLESLKAK